MEMASWPVPEKPNDGVLVWHISDTHFGYRDWSEAEGEVILQDRELDLVPDVDIAVHTGDIVDGDTNLIKQAREDAYAKTWLKRAKVDLWAMGNHDVRERQVTTRAEWEAVYGRPANTYTDVNGYRFITFAVDAFTGTDSLWTVPEATWDWVAETAEAHPGPVVIAEHYPPSDLSDKPENSLLPQTELDLLFGDCPNIVGMLCGHMHKDIIDTSAASFTYLGGRNVPVLTDISAMLSLEGLLLRDQSGWLPSITAYVEMRETEWRVSYRNHGGHKWTGPQGNRATYMDLSTGMITHGT